MSSNLRAGSHEAAGVRHGVAAPHFCIGIFFATNDVGGRQTPEWPSPKSESGFL